MTVVVVICAVLLTAAAVMALIRAERGPTMLDRTVAFDTITAILIGAVAVHAVATGRTDTVPVILALSLVGFVGSVAISRFAAAEPEGEGRVLSREELAELEPGDRPLGIGKPDGDGAAGGTSGTDGGVDR
jgi:multicomponent Na+:H+ antiporter subunit F